MGDVAQDFSERMNELPEGWLKEIGRASCRERV